MVFPNEGNIWHPKINGKSKKTMDGPRKLMENPARPLIDFSKSMETKLMEDPAADHEDKNP